MDAGSVCPSVKPVRASTFRFRLLDFETKLVFSLRISGAQACPAIHLPVDFRRLFFPGILIVRYPIFLVAAPLFTFDGIFFRFDLRIDEHVGGTAGHDAGGRESQYDQQG